MSDPKFIIGHGRGAPGIKADLAAARFSEREWRSKAQDKIAEVESLEAELRTLQGENEAMRIDQEVTHNEAFAYQQQIGRLRTALDDARGLVEKWRGAAKENRVTRPSSVIAEMQDLHADELEAALQSSPMNEEPEK